MVRVVSSSASLPHAALPIALIVLEMLIYHIHQNFATLADYWLPISIRDRWTLSPWKNLRPNNSRKHVDRRLLRGHFSASDTTYRCDNWCRVNRHISKFVTALCQKISANWAKMKMGLTSNGITFVGDVRILPFRMWRETLHDHT